MIWWVSTSHQYVVENIFQNFAKLEDELFVEVQNQGTHQPYLDSSQFDGDLQYGDDDTNQWDLIKGNQELSCGIHHIISHHKVFRLSHSESVGTWNHTNQ